MSKEEVEREWVNRVNYSNLTEFGAIELFKSALRKEVESYIKNTVSPGDYYSGKIQAYENVLELLDSLTPPKQ